MESGPVERAKTDRAVLLRARSAIQQKLVRANYYAKIRTASLQLEIDQIDKVIALERKSAEEDEVLQRADAIRAQRAANKQ